MIPQTARLDACHPDNPQHEVEGAARPVYPTVRPGTLSDSHRQALPADLKLDRSWVLWRYVVRDGKRTKEPYQTNRRRAKTDTPRTWTTFEKAVEAYERDDFFDGIGFVFHEGNPYAGADMDGVTEDDARHWIDRFDSYTERSPSGNGLHVIIKGELPKGTKRKTGELYSSGRFFTVTGDVVRDAPIRDAQDAADEFYAYLRKDDRKPPERAPASFDNPDLEDAEVLRLLENARNGHEFATIYAGLGDFPSKSERDISLANRIAFYTQDEGQVERIMRGSGCAREKWDKHRTYLRDTIRKAISDLPNTYTPGFATANVTNITTARVSKKIELQAGVQELVRRWWEYDWARVTGTGKRSNWMRGHTCRDVMIVLIDAAAKHGKVAGNNIEVSMGRRRLALLAATSTRTVHKAVKHLEEEGWLEFRPSKSEEKPGAYVMRATLHHLLTSTRGVGVEEEGGGEDLRGRRSVPRLRWSAPYVPRLGKHNCAIIDRLVREGDMHVDELAEAMNKRTRDLLRRNLPKLIEAGIVSRDVDTVRLAADWRDALERKREADGEIEAEERDRKKYQEQSENYRNRDKTPADEVPPLKGREKMAEIVAERTKEDVERRIEEQRQKVGTTAETFIHDKLKALGYVRLDLLKDVYEDAGGNPRHVLPAAVRLGCRIERLPKYQNERFVFPPAKKVA